MTKYYIDDFKKILNNTRFDINFIQSDDNAIEFIGNDKICDLLSFTQYEKTYEINIFFQKQSFELNNQKNITINIYYKTEQKPEYEQKMFNKFSKKKKLPHILSI